MFLVAGPMKWTQNLSLQLQEEETEGRLNGKRTYKSHFLNIPLHY